MLIEAVLASTDHHNIIFSHVTQIQPSAGKAHLIGTMTPPNCTWVHGHRRVLHMDHNTGTPSISASARWLFTVLHVITSVLQNNIHDFREKLLRLCRTCCNALFTILFLCKLTLHHGRALQWSPKAKKLTFLVNIPLLEVPRFWVSSRCQSLYSFWSLQTCTSNSFVENVQKFHSGMGHIDSHHLHHAGLPVYLQLPLGSSLLAKQQPEQAIMG